MLNNIFRLFSFRLPSASDRIANLRMDELDGQTFAIQNVSTKKNLRPYRARKHDNNPVILYVHHSWRCLTWHFSRTEDGNFRLINYYTGKTLDIKSPPEEGVPLVQSSAIQDAVTWKFTEVASGVYAISLVGTRLYITASSDETNSPITLSPYADISGQKWRLIRQKPWF